MIYRHTQASTRRRPIVWLASALALLAIAAAPSAAMASSQGNCTSPPKCEYQPKSQQIAATGGGGGGDTRGGGSGGPTAATSAHSTIGGLPFTGLDIGVLALAAVALLGAGFALRRLSDPTRRSSS
jgi:hypothetical protein